MPIFAISEGWNVMGPRSIQRLKPDLYSGSTSTNSSSASEPAKPSKAQERKQLKSILETNSITATPSTAYRS